MNKYNPLWKYVRDNNCKSLTFEEIKSVLGFEINHSFLTYKKQLNEYGFEVSKISMKEKTVMFSKK